MSDQESRPIWIALEDAFILLSVAAVWPRILGWHGMVWEMMQYVAVGGLIWIFVRGIGETRSEKAPAFAGAF